MRLFKKQTPAVENHDAALVMASLGGDRDAFCQIVTRYQSLLCSVAYSSVGDLKHSEDIAQETFVEAWAKLDTLKDPEKLKSWLCGILRFKVSHHHRKEANQPVKNAEDIDEHNEKPCEQSQLESAAIDAQEQTLLWKTLEQMPENYREPLVLFYREQCSVTQVANELDLSEDVIKQRLSRGRKMLQAAMVTFVEDTLAKSKPGAAFTLAVMAVVNGIAPPAQAAALGFGAVKTGSALKWTGVIVFIASISGLISTFFGLRSGLDQSRTQRERRNIIWIVSLFLLSALIYVVAMFALKYLAIDSLAAGKHVGTYAVLSQSVVLGFIASYCFLLAYGDKRTQRIRAEERIFHPEAFDNAVDKKESKRREHKSRFRLFGVPLFHFQFGMIEKDDPPAIGWIAGGETAYGVLFAWGAVAVAPVSVGIISVGLISIGAIGIGLFGIGTVALGVIAFGASAIGYKAYASLSALGWESAISGGFSIAKDAAIGPISFAKHVHNETAAQIANLDGLNQNYLWVLVVMAILVIVPAVWHSNMVRKRMRVKEG